MVGETREEGNKVPLTGNADRIYQIPTIRLAWPHAHRLLYASSCIGLTKHGTWL